MGEGLDWGEADVISGGREQQERDDGCVNLMSRSGGVRSVRACCVRALWKYRRQRYS